MIIVNIFGIIIGLISLLVVAILSGVFPSLVTSDRWGDAFLITAAILSFMSEFFGIKARVFIFIPVWLLGLIYAGFKLHARWGALGIATVVVAAGALFSALYVVGREMERRSWKATQKRLLETDLRQYSPQTTDFWKKIKSLFFVPASIPNDRALCQHNRQIIAFLLEGDKGFSEEETKRLRELAEQLQNGQTSVQPVKIESRLYETVVKIIEDRAKPSKKTPPPISSKVQRSEDSKIPR
jgi:hypothetical protein